MEMVPNVIKTLMANPSTVHDCLVCLVHPFSLAHFSKDSCSCNLYDIWSEQCICVISRSVLNLGHTGVIGQFAHIFE